MIIKISEYSNKKNILFEEDDLKLERKKKYVLIGKNGSGKSTLLDLIYKKKLEIVHDDLESLKICYMKQSYLLYENLSLHQNCCILSENNEITKEIIKVLQINPKKKLENLSQGQLQFIYIWIQLQKKADLYLIDEPFNNLEERFRYIVLEKINNLSGIVILVDHLHISNYDKIFLENRRFLCQNSLS